MPVTYVSLFFGTVEWGFLGCNPVYERGQTGVVKVSLSLLMMRCSLSCWVLIVCLVNYNFQAVIGVREVLPGYY